MKKIKIAVILLILLSVSTFAQKDTLTIKPNLVTKKLPFGLTSKVPEILPKISVVLSGGGARAIVSLGVLKSLVEHKIPIESIVGTSMGSILGGLFASGYSIEELDSIITSIDWNYFYSSKETRRNELYLDQKITEDIALITLDIDGLTPVIPTAFNSGQRFQNFLNNYTINAPIHQYKNFDELKYRFRAVSTDLATGEMVILEKGSLAQALRASSSVTFLLDPVEVDSMLLVDGGLVANIPTKAAKAIGSDYIIAVNMTSNLRKRSDLDTPLKVADQIVSIPMNLVTEQNLKLANIIIDPDLGGKKSDDFTSLDTLIQIGYDETTKIIGKIRNDIHEFQLKNIADSVIYFNNLFPFDPNSKLESKIASKFNGSKQINNKEIYIAICNELLTGRYFDITANLIYDKDSAFIKIDAIEKSKVKKINLIGNEEVNKEKIENILIPIVGDFYCNMTLINYLIKIQSYYRNIGFPFAEIEKINFNDKSGELSISIDEGIVDEIVVDGNERSSNPLIFRELEIKEGEYLTSEKLSKSLENLRTTGLFNSVDINIKKNNETNILKVTVEDKLTGVARFGITVDNERFLQPIIDVRNENLFGTGTEFGFHFSGGLRNQLLLIEHKANRIFDTYLTYKIKGYYDAKDIFTYVDDPQTSANVFSRSNSGEYRQELFGISVGVGTQTGKFGNLIAEFRYEKNKVLNLTNEVVSPYSKNLAAFRFSMKIDTQDKYPYPLSGIFLHSYYETAQQLIAGDESYIKYALFYRNYFSITPNHTIIPKFEIGFADETLPLSQQFFFGGIESFFGFRENEYRGRQIIVGGLTYRYKPPFKILFDTYFSVLYNLGSIWEREEEMRFAHFKHGVGAIISFDSPVGPIDFGYGRSFTINKLLDKIVVRGEPTFYFSLGFFL